jgi:hypothetical protein
MALDARDPNRQPFRFFDNREKYLLFVSTCDEKQVVAQRVAMDVAYLRPTPPALRVFDAGMGDATVLSLVLKHLHHRFPTVPFLVVCKETSHEDVRISLEKMADRLHEHPQTVLVVTNMLYSEAPSLCPKSEQAQRKLNWLEVALEGTSAYEFDVQLRGLQDTVRQWWQTRPSSMTGNPLYVKPAALVVYRKDQEWPLRPVLPKKGDTGHEYDLIIAAQPFRARSPATTKVRNVLAPIACTLAPSGVMIVIQSTGKDTGMEIIRSIWPHEDPFRTPRHQLLKELRSQIGETQPDLRFLSYPDSRAEFRFKLQLDHTQATNSIGTSTLLAAWNAATYVAQIDDDRLGEAMGKGE